MAGKEVVQVYASSPENPSGQPPKNLLLMPGETQLLTITFAEKVLAWYDTSRTTWILDAGSYEVLCGASSRDLHSSTTLEFNEEKLLEKTTKSV